MAKRRTKFSDKKIIDNIKAGIGSGEGGSYKPWLTIHSFPSKGKVTRILGLKSGRIHHLMSSHELNLFYILEWSDTVTDIREQYPLLDREETISIADDLGIKHPADPKTGIPIVMTTDFLVTSKTDDGMLLTAIFVKPSKDLDNGRVREKFEIEKEYWNKRNIYLKVVTERNLPRQIITNIKWIYRFKRPEDLGYETPELLNSLISLLTNRLSTSHQSIISNLNLMDKEYEKEPGTFLKIFKHLIATKQIPIDMNHKINLNRCLEIPETGWDDERQVLIS